MVWVQQICATFFSSVTWRHQRPEVKSITPALCSLPGWTGDAGCPLRVHRAHFQDKAAASLWLCHALTECIFRVLFDVLSSLQCIEFHAVLDGNTCRLCSPVPLLHRWWLWRRERERALPGSQSSLMKGMNPQHQSAESQTSSLVHPFVLFLNYHMNNGN